MDIKRLTEKGFRFNKLFCSLSKSRAELPSYEELYDYLADLEDKLESGFYIENKAFQAKYKEGDKAYVIHRVFDSVLTDASGEPYCNFVLQAIEVDILKVFVNKRSISYTVCGVGYNDRIREDRLIPTRSEALQRLQELEAVSK